MSGELGSTLLKLAIPVGATAAMLFASNKRGLAPAEIGLRVPPIRAAAAWLGLWVVVITAEEFIGRWLHVGAAKPWTQTDGLIVLLRILAIGIAGPIAEELAFRGVLFAWMLRWKWRLPVVVIASSAAWTLLHFDDSAATLALVFFDGIVLALARVQTRSVLVPMAMHVMGNMFSIWQSLAP